MADKQALRELQTRLAERLQRTRLEQPGMSWLAVDCAGQGLLLALRQAGEIFKPAALLAVPNTQPWLAGLVNLRGGVYTAVDLAAFLGLRQPGPPAATARLVGFNAALEINCALLVDRLEGLRHAAELQPEPEPADNALRPAFALGRWVDGAGRIWQEIDLSELARLPQFLAITG